MKKLYLKFYTWHHPCEFIVDLERWHYVPAFLEQVLHESLELKVDIGCKCYLLSESRRIRAFVKKEKGYRAVKVKTGLERENLVQILEGVTTEDVLVSNAQYLIDSGSFIKTK